MIHLAQRREDGEEMAPPRCSHPSGPCVRRAGVPAAARLADRYILPTPAANRRPQAEEKPPHCRRDTPTSPQASRSSPGTQGREYGRGRPGSPRAARCGVVRKRCGRVSRRLLRHPDNDIGALDNDAYGNVDLQPRLLSTFLIAIWGVEKSPL